MILVLLYAHRWFLLSAFFFLLGSVGVVFGLHSATIQERVGSQASYSQAAAPKQTPPQASTQSPQLSTSLPVTSQPTSTPLNPDQVQELLKRQKLESGGSVNDPDLAPTPWMKLAELKRFLDKTTDRFPTAIWCLPSRETETLYRAILTPVRGKMSWKWYANLTQAEVERIDADLKAQGYKRYHEETTAISSTEFRYQVVWTKGN